MAKMQLVIFSFGYKYGCPRDTNFLLDIRCLPNPFWEDSLRARNGQDGEIAAYVLDSSEGRELKGQLLELLRLWLVQQAAADKEVLRLAIGCTGGRHRSVAMTEFLAAQLSEQYPVELFHRDMEKDSF
ncbi:hypothetical protein JWG39_00190 [Desulforhopalus vacuolatus]|uniref:RapZ C-terminal domain-containing protein n=1 Tax=Desulforhopalus vacuolatus TaxID=40414 RepID=UPI001962A3EB|nr:RNase adapter RapZ [Desulforhopalus vacuolatus]MBM9518232.1 hypothetical protein [Desulforhopalus vacuolatus]